MTDAALDASVEQVERPVEPAGAEASTGTSTFGGSDLDTINATWQVVWF